MTRLWLVPYHAGWSYDLTAKALRQHLSDRYDVQVLYQGGELRRLNLGPRDLVVDFWWGGRLDLRYGRRVLKQVSSHRWADRRHGQLTNLRLASKHLKRCGGVVVPSKRLHAELSPVVPFIAIGPKGFHPELMGDYDQRGGQLTVGWAGNAAPSDKNVSMLLKAWSKLYVADACLTQGEMSDFYNGLDVITIASDAEGDPRPLIEGMACGCFPVTVDVGIVPELVRHGENGLIVERTPEAFASALAWCRENIDRVRAAGRRNAQEMSRTRTWAMASLAWAGLFEQTLDLMEHQ